MRPAQHSRAQRPATWLGIAATAICLPLTLAAPRPALCQTNDVYFRSWTWRDTGGGARASAVAGTTVALADDLAGLATNPATLATLSRSELSLSVALNRKGHTAVGDIVATRNSVDELSAAFKLGARTGVAVFRREPQARHIDLAALPAADGAQDQGSLSAISTDIGLALARSFGSHLALGVAVTRCHLAFQAEYRRITPPLPAVVQVGAADGTARLAPSFGASLSIGRRIRLGLSHRVGVRWHFQRVAISPLLSLTLDSGTPMRIARPAVTSLGAQISLSRRLALSAQVDYLVAASVAPGVLEGYRQLSVPRQTWEPRAAIELALPTTHLSVLLRSGVHWRTRPALVETLTPPSPSLPGVAAWAPPPPVALFQSDAPQPVVQRLDARGSFGAGVALVTRLGVRLDLALRADREQTALSASTSWRF
jgi:hypothetical protein